MKKKIRSPDIQRALSSVSRHSCQQGLKQLYIQKKYTLKTACKLISFSSWHYFCRWYKVVFILSGDAKLLVYICVWMLEDFLRDSVFNGSLRVAQTGLPAGSNVIS